MSKPSGRAASNPAATSPEISLMAFEQALTEVESIIDRIEAGEVGLEESLTAYERGVKLVAHCRSKLDAAQQQVDDLTRRLEPADDTGSTPSDPSSPDDEGEPSDEPAPF